VSGTGYFTITARWTTHYTPLIFAISTTHMGRLDWCGSGPADGNDQQPGEYWCGNEGAW
jgi:hypothetical protein